MTTADDVAAQLRFLPHDTVTQGVRERRIDVHRPAGVVPAMLWTPSEPGGTRPLVLIGHGASGTKVEGYVVALARMLVRHHGMAALAIDGPVHGDRRTADQFDGNLMFLEFGQRWYAEPSLPDDMVSDWRAALHAVQELPEVGTGPVGYWGLSMGTILGLPLVVAEPQISVAVLGLMGVAGPARQRVASDAAKVTCPVLFLVQWDDDLFTREQAFALFDAIGTPDKRMHANPGAHSSVPAEEFALTARFLADHLAVDT